MNLEFTFEETPWEQALSELNPGDCISAVRFLALMEEETEEAVENALQDLEEKGVTLALGDLPNAPASEETALRLQRERKLVQTGRLLQELEETDPLRIYLEELSAIPVAGDVQVLALELLEGKEAVMPRLVDGMLSTVVELAQQNVGRGVLLLDLIQEGSLGLWQGILCYRGGDFADHCRWWIGQYMAKAIVLQARSAGICGKMRQGMQDYLDTDQRLLTELGRNPTLEEIAEAMHASVEEAASYYAMVLNAREKSNREEEPEQSPEDDQAVEDTAYFQSRQRIDQLLSALAPEDAQFLTLRFGLQGGTPMQLEEIARKLGMTTQEIIEKETALLAVLRQRS